MIWGRAACPLLASPAPACRSLMAELDDTHDVYYDTRGGRPAPSAAAAWCCPPGRSSSRRSGPPQRHRGANRKASRRSRHSPAPNTLCPPVADDCKFTNGTSLYSARMVGSYNWTATTAGTYYFKCTITDVRGWRQAARPPDAAAACATAPLEG